MTWTHETVRGEVLKVFVEHAEPGALVKESSDLVGDLGIDSLGVAEIMAEIEDKFALQIPEDALREIDTVADVAAQIEGKLKAEGRLEG